MSIANVSATRVALVLACGLAMSGCGTVKGWFGGKDKGERLTDPAELTDFAASTTPTRLWSTSVGKGEDVLGARQGPVVADGKVYAAAVYGGVQALDLNSGARLWQYRSDLPLSGGPGAGDGLVVVGSLEGDVIALDAATGTEKWTAKVPNEVIAAPVIGQGMVFVRSNDGRVSAFDANSGERRWFNDSTPPALTVRGNDGVVLGPGYVFSGGDDGMVKAFAIADGRPLWEQAVAQPDGRSELDRMADVDGTPALDGPVLFASSYKNSTVAIEAPSGRVLWESGNGGPGRVGVSADRVVVSDRNGTVWGIDKTSGSGSWQQPALARRNLSGVAVQGDYAVVGDYDGYLHWLNLSDGQFAARTRAAKDAIRAAPVVADGILLVQSTGGDLSAWRVGQ